MCGIGAFKSMNTLILLLFINVRFYCLNDTFLLMLKVAYNVRDKLKANYKHLFIILVFRNKAHIV